MKLIKKIRNVSKMYYYREIRKNSKYLRIGLILSVKYTKMKQGLI